MAAIDGQTFESQSPDVQASFIQIWGQMMAPQVWEMQHNAALGHPQPMYYKPEVGPGTAGSVPYINAATGAVTTTPGQFPGYNLPAGGQSGGGYSFPFLPNYQEFAMRQPGYVPGSGTYNQWRLDTPGLFDASGYNLQTGSGGPGDPNTGREPQSPAEWLNAPQLFVKTISENLPDQFAPALNGFLRGDNIAAGKSGLGSPQPTPEQFANLREAMAAGVLQPTEWGARYLRSQGQSYSGPVAPTPAGTAGGGGAPGGGGAAGGMTTEDTYWQNRAAVESADQAARLTYLQWQMSTGNDRLAMEKAQQAWSQKFAEESRAQQFGLQEAGVTGYYGGNPTLARQAQEQGTALNLLQLGAGLRGPANYLSYLRTLGNTPQGLKDLVNGLAGQYQFAFSPGQTPGSTFERQSLGTIARDMAGAAPAGGGMSVDASGAVLPSGDQWNARNFGIIAKNPTQLGLTRNLYEESGRDWNQEYANFLNSLPRYGGPQRAQISWG